MQQQQFGVLPSDWEARLDQYGRIYYIDHKNRRTQWDDPRPFPQGWEKRKDERSNRYYYVCHATKTTQWTDPRPALDMSKIQGPKEIPKTSNDIAREGRTLILRAPTAESGTLKGYPDFGYTHPVHSVPYGRVEAWGVAASQSLVIGPFGCRKDERNVYSIAIRNISKVIKGSDVSPLFVGLKGIDKPESSTVFSIVTFQNEIIYLNTMTAGTRQAYIEFIKEFNRTVIIEEAQCLAVYTQDPSATSPMNALKSTTTSADCLDTYSWMLRALFNGSNITPDQLLVLKAYRDEHKLTEAFHAEALKNANLDEESFKRKYVEKDKTYQCISCYDALSDTVVVPCFHVCLCEGCAELAKGAFTSCPVCNGPVERLQKIY